MIREGYDIEKFEDNPVLSVIVPVYNSESVVQQCLDSILQQAGPDFELIIVDDGSADGSGEICDRIAGADERVRVFHEKNGGVSRARNTGIERARGKWVTFVDHDDALPADAFAGFSDLMENDDIDIIQGQVYKLRENEELPANLTAPTDKKLEFMDIYEYSSFGGVYRTNVWGKLYRSELLKTCRFPVNHYCEDIYFNGLYFSNAQIKKAAVLQNCTYVYRVNDNSASHQWGRRFSTICAG